MRKIQTSVPDVVIPHTNTHKDLIAWLRSIKVNIVQTQTLRKDVFYQKCTPTATAVS